MRDITVLAKAPANIALVKYMGKKDPALNLPENTSISLTLNSLCTFAQASVALDGKGEVKWSPEPPSANTDIRLYAFILNDKSISRLTNHIRRVIQLLPGLFDRFGIYPGRGLIGQGSVTLRTANTFPASSGIASSASSFAAVTLSVAASFAEDLGAFRALYAKQTEFKWELAAISRLGSGSSCRSFEGPWVFWDNDLATKFFSNLPKMAHFVVVVSDEPKTVPSSQAHELVRTSPLWSGRAERARQRANEMAKALRVGDLSIVARIAWSDAWEMHSMFHTCAAPFSYWEPETVALLKQLSPLVYGESPPIVTVDAGPNIHIIVPEDQRAAWKKRLEGKRILEDEQGDGAVLLGV